MPSRLTDWCWLLLTTPAVIFWSYQNITAGVANNSFVLSLYTVPTVQSQTAINHTLSQFTSLAFPASSLSTLPQHLPSIVQPLWRTQRTSLSSSQISRSNLSDESWKQTLLRVALLRKAIPKLYFHETMNATSLKKPTTHTPTTSPPSWVRLLLRTRIRVHALGLAHTDNEVLQTHWLRLPFAEKTTSY